jgi:hypothetical protein
LCNAKLKKALLFIFRVGLNNLYPYFYSVFVVEAGGLPVFLTLTALPNKSNQNGAPIAIAIPLIIQPGIKVKILHIGNGLGCLLVHETCLSRFASLHPMGKAI